MSERLDYHELVEGRIPPWVMRFIKNVGKTINEYGMVKAGDEVLLAVSGGKDSLALALALSLRLKWLPVDYSLSALMIDWREHPIPDEAKERLKEYFSTLSIDFTIQQAPQFPPSFDGDFNCYLCSRNRRRILFEEADRRGVKLIAMGHHLDDLVETSLMNHAPAERSLRSAYRQACMPLRPDEHKGPPQTHRRPAVPHRRPDEGAHLQGPPLRLRAEVRGAVRGTISAKGMQNM